ncbi:C-type lectin domain-containing protein [Kordiimonas marina]|uniref:C-type lectin domain-containing protein n=1 Tax=Kordiimonas marina TaxID=2872312 RepID=UPI001FF1DC14|nr:C-type lectin domain-containing protein [Kordiimonas marina]MCJ9430388.1 C-type lectin domain-containing protein [Kordiimonas marina]
MSFLGMIAIVATLFQGGVDATGTAIARPLGEAHEDPSTGNYYQIFQFYGPKPYTWAHAKHMVHGYIYEGRVGQLASVKTLETHYFLLLQFPEMRKHKTWIGLSAQCNEQADLEWLDGTKLEDTNFRAWAADAQRKISRTCRDHRLSGNIYPIYYMPDAFGVRWEMGQSNTDIEYMVVEFPKSEDPKAAGQKSDSKDKPEGAKDSGTKKPADDKGPSAGR